MFYCEKIGEIVDFFQWIEEAYYELQKDFPNFSNSSQIAVIESTYQTYITAKGKPIQANHPPCISLIMKTAEDRVIDAIPFKHGVTNDGITHVLQQNNYTNMCMQSISKQTSRIEEIVSKIGKKPFEKGESSKTKEDSVPFKPPPSFENEKFHLNSKKDSEFVEELIVRLQKIKVKEQKTQIAITTLKEGNSSEETPNEEVQVNKISRRNKISKQYSKPYFPRPSPVDIQFEEKADFAQFNGESIVEWNIDGMSEYQIKTIVKYMLMYASAAKLKGNKDEAIAKAIITGFTGQLQGTKSLIGDLQKNQTSIKEKALKRVLPKQHKKELTLQSLIRQKNSKINQNPSPTLIISLHGKEDFFMKTALRGIHGFSNFSSKISVDHYPAGLRADFFGGGQTLLSSRKMLQKFGILSKRLITILMICKDLKIGK
ncbi:hypothetical protein CDL12_10872 [Handroanthus impetiginosus]|uniref:DUF7746 domain-containing protein n=1 Tax=Handroanthus impetiginosus TaxID=429701 RepID=A0A2G9HG33_9LAMI|nr:hypothetical protein CDL12_10872 [Handroanthus impetiginosus]